MSKENTSIHDFDLSLICEYYAGLERQGPGSPDATIKALSFIEGLNNTSKIADLGCGTGGQTMVLAQNTEAHITGIDLFPEFIDIFNARASKLELQHRLIGKSGSMESLPFKHEELDLIWSEGAIYNIGFERGLREWRHFLKPGGYVAVTEASWFTSSRPDEVNDFWQSEYPRIDTIANCVNNMQKAGFLPVACFVLPKECWTDNYYKPMVPRHTYFLKKHKGNAKAEALVENLRHEAALYDKFKDHYGYVFYIGRKI